MGLEFKNPEVAAEFEPLRSIDTKIHVPSGKSIPGQPKVGYSGMLSGITKEAAEKHLASGGNLLKRKETKQAAPPKNNKTEKEEK